MSLESLRRPDETLEEDMAILEGMAVDLRVVLNEHQERKETTVFNPIERKVFSKGANPKLVDHIIIYKPEALAANQVLYVVGFHGQARPKSERPPGLNAKMNKIDGLIREELSATPIFSYHLRRRANGQWVNQMMFPTAESSTSVRSANHRKAVENVAPWFYDSIKLRRATIPGGLMSENPMEHTRTDYLDMKAIREQLQAARQAS